MRIPKTTWVVALAIAAGGGQLYRARYRAEAPKPALPALSIAVPVPTAVPVPVPVPDSIPTPRATPAPAVEPALARAAAEAAARGDEVHAAIALFRATRELGESAERSDAMGRVRALESSAMDRAAKARAAGDAAGERAALTVAYLAALDPAARAAHRDALEPLTKEEFFSGRPTPDAEFYTVQRGDTLTKIAARFDFPVEGIRRVNRLGAAQLRPGERLKVPKGPIEVFVVKGEFRMALLANGKLVREYQVGTGRDGCTPETCFTVEEKIPEPTWHSRDGVFPYGHPKNILGTRWLGFKNTAEYHGFGIHGTPFPESIGHEVSSGCIRMRNAEVEEVFALVPKGATVTITR